MGHMKTRRALIVLKSGWSREVSNVDDDTWSEYLRLNRDWLTGGTGPVNIHHSDGSVTSFEFADIERIDLWPGSEEPR